MTQQWLNMLVGEEPLPKDILARAELLDFADSHHVLGQMAEACKDKAEGKTLDVFENGLLRARFDHNMLHFEMERVERAFQGTGLQPILLKGASYVAQNLKAGLGRRVSDIDILLPEKDIPQAETLLKNAGWAFDEATDNSYDQQYYRTKMHELPPLRHNTRRTVIDVHFLLLPRTSRIQPNTQAFIEHASLLENRQLKVFTPIDRLLHSAIHTFADGDFDTPARSLIELNYLFADITPDSYGELLERASDVAAKLPFAYALWTLAEFFGNLAARDLAEKFMQRKNGLVCWSIRQKLNNIEKARVAKVLLYVRSHYLRMSVPALFWHLLTKSYRHIKKQPELPLPPGFQ